MIRSLSNKRQLDESFEEYRLRLRLAKYALKKYSMGRRAPIAKDGSRYTPGPHPSHKPHDVIEKALDKLTGEMVDLIVTHPGTLIKVKA